MALEFLIFLMTFGWIFYLAFFAFWLWMFVDLLTKQKKMKQNDKIIWVVLFLVFSLITAIVYAIIKKKWK